MSWRALYQLLTIREPPLTPVPAAALSWLDHHYFTLARKSALLQGLLLPLPLVLPFVLVFGGDFALADEAWYHAAIARHYAGGDFVRGGLTALPWTQLAAEPYPQGYLLLHLLLAPLHWLLSPEDALLAGGALIAVLFTASLFAVLRLWGVSGAFWWGIAGWLTLPLSFAALVRLDAAAPLAPLALWALDALVRRRPLQLLIVCALAAWATPTAPLLLTLALGFSLAAVMAERRLALWPLVCTLAGLTLGLVLHPYFPGNLSWLWYETRWLFTDLHASLNPPDPVVLDADWRRPAEAAPQFAALWQSGGALLPLAALSALAAMVGSAPGGRERVAAALLALSLAVAVLLGIGGPGTHQLLLACALALTPLALHQLAAGRAWIALAALLWLAVWSAVSLPDYRPSGSTRSQQIADRALLATTIRALTPPGEVMLAPWQSFPWLHYFNPDHRYAAGLDPALSDLTSVQFQAFWHLYRGNLTDPEVAMQQYFDGARVLLLPTSAQAALARITPETFTPVTLRTPEGQSTFPNWLLFIRNPAPETDASE